MLASYARLAQLVRAPRLHRGGQGFDSLGAHQFKTPLILEGSFIYNLIKILFYVRVTSETKPYSHIL
jgi:hypothetical protein